MWPRSKQRNIRSDVIKNIEKYRSIQNVAGDGNCTFYASIVGLEHQGIPVNSNIKELRKSVYDHIQNTKKDSFNTMTFTGNKGGKANKISSIKTYSCEFGEKIQVINRSVIKLPGYMPIQCFQLWLISSDVTLYGLI